MNFSKLLTWVHTPATHVHPISYKEWMAGYEKAKKKAGL